MREVVEVLLGPEHRAVGVVDVEERLQVLEDVGAAEGVHVGVRQLDPVARRQLEHQFGLERPLDVHVQLGLGQLPHECVRLGHGPIPVDLAHGPMVPHGDLDARAKWIDRSALPSRVSGVKSPDMSPAEARSGPAADDHDPADAQRRPEEPGASARRGRPGLRGEGARGQRGRRGPGGRRRHGHALPPLPLEGGPHRGAGVRGPRGDDRHGRGGGGTARRDGPRALPPGVERLPGGASRLPAQVLEHRSPPGADGARS